MLQNTVYMAHILKVIWPALQIEEYLPHPTCSASSSVCSGAQSNTNSLCASESAHPTKPTTNATSVTVSSTDGASKHTTSIADTNAGIPETPSSPPRKHSIDSVDSIVTFEGDDGEGLSDQDDELIGPMPDEHHNNTHMEVTNSNSTAANVAHTSSPSTTQRDTVETRPIDGLRFLRELFAMSKFMQPEKRYTFRSMYRCYYNCAM